ncbi:MAG: alcohol dehydrogenase catalytic domain-containing protein [Chloroflexota bacterium]
MRRALVVDRPGEIAVVDRPDLKPGPGEVVARPRFVGVCATDLELLRGQVDPAYVRYPIVIGHEWSGHVEAVGPGVTGLAAGDPIVSEGVIPCGVCQRCREGRTHLCLTYDEIGFTRDGAASDQLVVPARLVHRLAPAIELLDAALVEPAAVVAQALGRLGADPAHEKGAAAGGAGRAPGSGDTVLIVGAGTIALLAAQLVRLIGPDAVFMLGRRPVQAPLAATVGADDFAAGEDVDPRDAFHRPEGFGLVIEAAGSVAAVATAIGAVRRGGTVLLLGLSPAGQTVAIRPDQLVNDDLTIVASFASTAPAWEHVVGLLEAGRIAPGRLVTHRFPLAEHRAAFAALESRSQPTGKVILEI